MCDGVQTETGPAARSTGGLCSPWCPPKLCWRPAAPGQDAYPSTPLPVSLSLSFHHPHPPPFSWRTIIRSAYFPRQLVKGRHVYGGKHQAYMSHCTIDSTQPHESTYTTVSQWLTRDIDKNTKKRLFRENTVMRSNAYREKRGCVLPFVNIFHL